MNIGIGYLFGARDNGLTRSIKALRGGLVGTTSDINDANRAASGFAKNFGDAIRGLQIGHISGQLDDLKSGLQGVTGSGLDTRLEQMSISFARGFGAKGVMSGLEGVKKEAFGVAFAMNRDAEAVADTALAFRKLGIESYSIKEMQQIVEATTLSGEQFASAFQDLSKSWGMGEAGTKAFLDRFTSINVQLGQGQEAFQNLPAALAAIDKGFAHLDMKPEDIENTVISMSRLGAALTKTLGVSVADAQQQSVEMFTALAQEGDAFQKMMVGMGGDLGSLTTELAQLGGGLEESLAVMQHGAKDPAKFMLGLNKTIAGLTENGSEGALVIRDRLMRSLEEINPNFVYLSKVTGDSVKQFEDILGVAPKAGQSLTSVAKAGFHTGLTLEESMDRAKMGMEQAFGGASREERVAFANAMIKSYKLVGDTVRNLTGESEKYAQSWREQAAGMGMSAAQADKLRGVLGPVVEYLATFSSAGVHGVLIKMFGQDSVLAGALGVMASGLGQLLPALLPLVAVAPALSGIVGPAFTAVGATLSTVLAPLAAVAAPLLAASAAIGVMYLAVTGKLPTIVHGIKDGIETAFKYVAGMGAELFTSVGDFLSGLDGEQLAVNAISFVKSAIRSIFSIFSEGFKTDPAVGAAATSLYDAFTYAVSSAFRVGGDFASTIYGEISAQIAAIDWPSAFASAASSIGSIDWPAMFRGLGDRLLSTRHVIADGLSSMFSDAASDLRDMDFAGAGEAVGAALAEGLKVGAGLVLKVGLIVGDLLIEGLRIVTTPQYWFDTAFAAWNALKLVVTGIFKIGEFFRGVFAGGRAELSSGLRSALDFGAMLAQVRAAYGDIRHWAVEKVVSTLDALTAAFQNVDWTSFGMEVGDLLVDALVFGVEGIGMIGGAIFDGVSSFAKMTGALGVLASEFIGGAFKDLFTVRFWKDSFSAIASGFRLAVAQVSALGGFISGIFLAIGKRASDAMFGPGTFDAGIETVKGLIAGLQTTFDNLWMSIRAGAEALFGNSINTFVAHDFGIIQEILASAQTWFGTFREVAQSVFSYLMTPFQFFVDRFKSVGELLAGLSAYFGFTPEQVGEVTKSASAPSGASTPAAAAQVARAGDSYLAQVIIEQHSKDRAVLESIYKRLSATGGEGPVQIASLAPARPTSTGR